MKAKIYRLFFLVLMMSILLYACSSAPKVDWTLTISGEDMQTISFSYSEMVDMPQIDLSEILMNKSVGDDEITSWSGVSLDFLFEKAGVYPEFSTITAVAADGYAIKITQTELQDAIIALQGDGEWIQKADPEHGPIRLVAPETPANRWVFQIIEIKINI